MRKPRIAFYKVICTILQYTNILFLAFTILIMQGCSRALVVPSCEYAGKCPNYFEFEMNAEQKISVAASADALAYYKAKSSNDWDKANKIKNKLISDNIKGISKKFWEQIESNVVTEGMSPLEVLCAWGQPDDSGEEPFYGFFDYQYTSGMVSKQATNLITITQRVRFKDTVIGSWTKEIVFSASAYSIGSKVAPAMVYIDEKETNTAKKCENFHECLRQLNK